MNDADGDVVGVPAAAIVTAGLCLCRCALTATTTACAILGSAAAVSGGGRDAAAIASEEKLMTRSARRSGVALRR